MQTKTALSRLTREKEQAAASLLQAEQAKAIAEVEVSEVSINLNSFPDSLCDCCICVSDQLRL